MTRPAAAEAAWLARLCQPGAVQDSSGDGPASQQRGLEHSQQRHEPGPTQGVEGGGGGIGCEAQQERPLLASVPYPSRERGTVAAAVTAGELQSALAAMPGSAVHAITDDDA